MAASWTDRGVLLLATGLGTGRSPYAPGTVGSLLGPLLIRGCQQTGLPSVALLMFAIVFVLIGIPICGRASKVLGVEDPGAVVYDEVAAFWVVYLPQILKAEPIGVTHAVLGFLLFRVFDITKPWPVRRLEHLPGGLGIMADDLAAGALAAVCLAGLEYGWPSLFV